VYAQNGLGGRFFPNFYVFLVGAPGTGKSTAIADIGADLLNEAGIRLAADSGTAAWLREGFKAAMNRSMTECEGDLSKVHSSVVVFADELETFLKSERYDPDLFTLLTKAYNCPDPLDHGTVLHGEQAYPKSFLTVLGGIQPDNLNKRIPPSTIGSGFTARVLFVYHPLEYKEITWNMEAEEGDPVLKAALVADLIHLQTLRGQYAVTSGYAERWNAFKRDTSQVEYCPLGPNLTTYWTRRHVHATKLAIVCAASRTDKLTLTTADFDRAVDILADAEQYMGFVVSNVTRTREMQMAEDLYKAMMKDGPKTFAWLHECYQDEISAVEMRDKVLRDLQVQGKVDSFHKDGVTYYRAKGGKE